ncbi:MAG: MoaD/ThiS family protein [Alphaproteobacteria bacterium]
MPRLSFTPNLERHLACPSARVPGDTVIAVLTAAFRDNPRLRGYLLDDQGRLRKHVNIFVNNEPVTDRDFLTDRVADGDEVFVFQALSGGAADLEISGG